MSHVLKNNRVWQPTATIAHLKHRARYLSCIREFFANRNIYEVETPLLSHATVTDPHIISIPAFYQALGSDLQQIYYLQTSPEYSMKRLLAAGSGAIYQITKAFRQGEVGRFHNPEFTMLEWYRPGFDHHQLMDELAVLLQTVFSFGAVERLAYAEVFLQYIGVDPHTATVAELKQCATSLGASFDSHDLNFWLDFLFTHAIEPHIGQANPVFIYDFPASQAALAKIRNETPPVASRFELYFKGLELANGFHELQDASEQRRRFLRDLEYRKQHNLPQVPLDELFLAALESGLPDCSGVAVGIDRLMMLALNVDCVSEALAVGFLQA